MTQTPSRDWQKDMERVQQSKHGRTLCNAPLINLAWQDGLPDAWEDIAGYWLQEAKVYKQSYEGTLTAWEAEKARADVAEARVKELENSRRFEFIGELRRDAAEKETLLAEEIIRLEAREQQLKEVIQEAQIVLEAKEPWPFKVLFKIRELLSTLYPDTPAQPAALTPGITARPIAEWHEDYGDALWWTFPIQEPPYCGSPLDVDWPNYHTHWTPLVIPAAPAPKEGE